MKIHSLILATVMLCGSSVSALEPESATKFEDSVRPLLVKYCGECHSEDEGPVDVAFLAAQRVQDLEKARGLWKSVAEQLENRTMPPGEEVQPTEQERLELAQWIDATLHASACTQDEYAGEITTRRLNRVEYDNTIRDLTGYDATLSQMFPVDGSGGEGFDNNGETLFLPPLLLERYLQAATETVDEVVLTPPRTKVFRRDEFATNGDVVDGTLLLKPKQHADAAITVYTAGEFHLLVEGSAVAEQKQVAKLRIKLDGINAGHFDFKGTPTDDKHEINTTKVQLARGPHVIRLVNVSEMPIRVERLKFEENQEKPSEEALKRHRSLVGHNPGEVNASQSTIAKEAIRKLARKAFRRPVTDSEVTQFLNLYQRATERGDPFEESLKLAFKGILVSPHFLFRVEKEPASVSAKLISDHELAVRLSYFLWGSMPDERLFELADRGQLQQEAVLIEEVNRMLADPKAWAFFEEFTGQWLGTHQVGRLVAPDTSRFKNQFSFKLLVDMRHEPVELFSHIVKEDRSLLELINADYGIMNERLQVHYRLAEPPKWAQKKQDEWALKTYQMEEGGEFEKVALKTKERGGVLGMGAVHLLTSYPNRTSPVLRGGWVLETLLGVRVPAPPPDVPEIKRGNKEKKSLREQLAKHREHASCAACHNLIDPVGFTLDHYDVLGRWREKDGNEPVDASGTFPSGETASGIDGLRAVLNERGDEFIEHLTRKMLGYALGRSLNDRDDCTVQRIATKVRQNDDSARVLIREIVLSTPFRMAQKSEH